MLPEILKIISQSDKRILFVGIGNVLKNDDGVGVYITNRIINSERVLILTVEVSIENYIGKINSLKPDILILVDCVEMKSPPGTCRLLKAELIRDITFNTHNISLQKIADFFKMEVFVIGIQPENIEFGEKISYLVKQVADQIINMINSQEVQNGY
jgi:hydrogenase 3 maturation protease